MQKNNHRNRRILILSLAIFTFLLCFTGYVKAEDQNWSGNTNNPTATDNNSNNDNNTNEVDNRNDNNQGNNDNQGNGDRPRGTSTLNNRTLPPTRGRELENDTNESSPDRRDDWAKNKCEIVTRNVEDRLNTFEDNKGKHLEKYNELLDKLTTLVTTLNNKGFDTTHIESDLASLKDLIAKFQDDYATFISQFKQVQPSACTSQTDFQASLAAARQQLAVVRSDTLAIRNFFLNVIKPDLMQLRQQSVEQEQSSESTHNESDN